MYGTVCVNVAREAFERGGGGLAGYGLFRACFCQLRGEINNTANDLSGFSVFVKSKLMIIFFSLYTFFSSGATNQSGSGRSHY